MKQFKDSLVKKADGVFYAKKNNIITIDNKLIEDLESEVQFTEKKRARVCFHSDESSLTHVMLVALANESLITPHSHIKNDEFYHLVKGELTITTYNTEGTVKKSINLEAGQGAQPSFCKMPANVIHSIKCTSPIAIYLEVAEGPFNFSNTTYHTFY